MKSFAETATDSTPRISRAVWIALAVFTGAVIVWLTFGVSAPQRVGFPVTAHMHEACVSAFGDQGSSAVADCEDRLAMRAAASDDIARQQFADRQAADADANGSPAYQAYVQTVSDRCSGADKFVACVQGIMTADEAAGRIPPR